jgi:uncharacterized OB-fold protein
MYCKSCHYSLENRGSLTEDRCPECGRAFDPDDPDSFLTTQEVEEIELDDRRWVITVVVVLCGIAIAIALAAVL